MSFQELFLPFSKIGKVSSNLWDFKSQTCTEPSEVPTKILMGVGAAFLSRKARAVTFWSMLRNNSGCTKAIFHAWTTLDWRYLGLHNGLLGWELHFCYWNMSRILVFVSQVNHHFILNNKVYCTNLLYLKYSLTFYLIHAKENIFHLETFQRH